MTYGTTVTVTCDAGYELQGSGTITCNYDTTFTFVEQPECKELGMHITYLKLNIENFT